MKISPVALLLILLVSGIGVAWFLRDPEEVQSAKVSPEVVETQLEESEENLKKQIRLLEGQVEYLQGQVGALQDDNTKLLQKLSQQGQRGIPKMDSVPAPADELPDFTGIELEMLNYRKLQALPLSSRGVGLSEVEKAILAWLRSQQPGDEAPKLALALRALGWIDAPVDPLPPLAAVLARQLGGWYDAKAGTLLVVDDPPAPGMPAPDRAFAVAFGQLLREYGVILFPGKQSMTTDERLARLALIIGDAALTRFLFSLEKAIPRATSNLPPEDPDHPLNQVQMPVYLKELALFPFARGFELAQSLHSTGGFAQINAAYSAPPATCAEVIEPERLLEAQRPMLIKAGPHQVKMMGETPFLEDRLGRFATFTALRAYVSDEEAGRAVQGWVGDRLLAYAAPEHDRDQALWETAWDSRESALAFFKAMRSCLTQRYDAKPTLDSVTELHLQAADRVIRLLILGEGKAVRLVDAAEAKFAEAAGKAL